MTVGRICCRDVDTADPDEPVLDAARRMGKPKVGSLVVVDVERTPVGILTDRDLAVRVLGAARSAADTCVADVMTPEPRAISEFSPIEEALAVMRSSGVRRMPVTGSDGRLSGVLSADDVLRLLIDELNEIGTVLEAEAPHAGPLV